MTDEAQSVRIRLQKQVTCPHCWEPFAPEDSLWLAEHPDLTGDPRLAGDQPLRFLPSRFNAQGQALDARGIACSELACPACHLRVPRAMLELPSCIFSILGTPSSGKSYLLAAMTWTLRKQLPQNFAVSFSDVDPLSNRFLNHYEELLFLNPDKTKLVALEKTKLVGDMYSEVRYGDRVVNYPKPLLFTVQTLPNHPQPNLKRGSVLCLYDNAGEHFQPGEDHANSPVTRHMARAQALFFLFDPTQDPRFRDACLKHSQDPQLLRVVRNERQDAVLQEAAKRVRRYTGLPEYEKHPQPLIVLVTKFDIWHPLLRMESVRVPFVRTGGGITAVDYPYIEKISQAVEKMLWSESPEIVATAKQFASHVYFLPVSATGSSPEYIQGNAPGKAMLGTRPNQMKPIWAEVPMLLALARYAKPPLIHYSTSSGEKRSAPRENRDDGAEGLGRQVG